MYSIISSFSWVQRMGGKNPYYYVYSVDITNIAYIKQKLCKKHIAG